MLVLTREVDGVICIGDDITVMVCSIKGGRVRLGIDAPKGIEVDRKEIRDAKDNSKRVQPSADGTDNTSSPEQISRGYRTYRSGK